MRIEKHKEHKKAGWVAFNLGVWISPDGKKARLMDFRSERRIRPYGKFKNSVLLECNLSNAGCKELRRISIRLKLSNFKKVKARLTDSPIPPSPKGDGILG